MHAGRILLAWLVAGIILVLGLLASGVVKIQIEKVDSDKKKKDKDKDKK